MLLPPERQRILYNINGREHLCLGFLFQVKHFLTTFRGIQQIHSALSWLSKKPSKQPHSIHSPLKHHVPSHWVCTCKALPCICSWYMAVCLCSWKGSSMRKRTIFPLPSRMLVALAASTQLSNACSISWLNLSDILHKTALVAPV